MSKKTTEEMKEVAATAKDEEKFFIDPESLDYTHMISTGSTLLDLAISGGRIRGGGLPGGIIVEIYGQSGLGKTQILDELIASTQNQGGDFHLMDPEARFKFYYYETMYGMEFPRDKYSQPDTVSGMFDFVKKWQGNEGVVNLIAADSLAALSTNLEMGDGDKMGMRRAKEFSEGLRATARILAASNKLLVATNQVREGDYGETTPGGKAFPFYATVRMSMKRHPKGWKITKSKTVDVGDTDKKVAMERQIGVRSQITVVKNSLDHPFREVPVSVVFDYGIDDISDMLQWYKDVTGDTRYLAFDKPYQSLAQAAAYIEKEDLADKLRDKVIDTWVEIEDSFRHKRPRKKLR